MPCGCKKGHGVSLHGAGVRRKRKRGGMSISGAGYKKRKRRRGRRGGGLGIHTPMYGPIGAAASIAGSLWRPKVAQRGLARGIMKSARSAAARFSRKGSGGRFLSGATWHGYGKGSGMSVSGAGLYGKRVLPRRGSGRRMI